MTAASMTDVSDHSWGTSLTGATVSATIGPCPKALKTTIGSKMDNQHWQRFFNARLDKWIALPKYRRDMIKVWEYLGMTPEEFLDWRAYDLLPERAIEVWTVANDLAAATDA